MAQWVKSLVSKSYNLCSISRTHTIGKKKRKGENRLPQVVLWTAHTLWTPHTLWHAYELWTAHTLWHAYAHTHTPIKTSNRKFKLKNNDKSKLGGAWGTTSKDDLCSTHVCSHMCLLWHASSSLYLPKQCHHWDQIFKHMKPWGGHFISETRFLDNSYV